VGVYDTRRGNIDGVAKTRQLLRCCDCLAVSTYVTTPHCSTIARLAFGAFCLAIPFDDFCESISIGKHLKLRDDPECTPILYFVNKVYCSLDIFLK
jgi:hypothetical protein